MPHTFQSDASASSKCLAEATLHHLCRTPARWLLCSWRARSSKSPQAHPAILCSAPDGYYPAVLRSRCPMIQKYSIRTLLQYQQYQGAPIAGQQYQGNHPWNCWPPPTYAGHQLCVRVGVGQAEPAALHWLAQLPPPLLVPTRCRVHKQLAPHQHCSTAQRVQHDRVAEGSGGSCVGTHSLAATKQAHEQAARQAGLTLSMPAEGVQPLCHRLSERALT